MPALSRALRCNVWLNCPVIICALLESDPSETICATRRDSKSGANRKMARISPRSSAAVATAITG